MHKKFKYKEKTPGNLPDTVQAAGHRTQVNKSPTDTGASAGI